MQYTKYIFAVALLYTFNGYGADQSAAAVAAGTAASSNKRPPLPIKPRLSRGGLRAAGASGVASVQAQLAKQDNAIQQDATSTTYTVRSANRELPKVIAHVSFITNTCVGAKKPNKQNLEGIVKYLDIMQQNAQQAMKNAKETEQQLIKQHAAVGQTVASPDSAQNEIDLPTEFSSSDMYTYIKHRAGQIQRVGDGLQQASSYATMESLGKFVNLLQQLDAAIPKAKDKLQKTINNIKTRDEARRKQLAPKPEHTPQVSGKVAAAAAACAAGSAPQLPPLPKKPTTSSAASASASTSALASAAASAVASSSASSTSSMSLPNGAAQSASLYVTPEGSWAPVGGGTVCG